MSARSASDILLEYVLPCLRSGQAELARCMEVLLANAGYAHLNYLRVHMPIAFLEPLLFAHLAHGHTHLPLEQILSGYDGAVAVGTLCLVTDKEGVLYFPRLGYVTQAIPYTQLTVDSTRLPHIAHLSVATSGITGTPSFTSSVFIPGTDIELASFSDPITARFLTRNGTTATVCTSHSDSRLLMLAEALRLLRVTSPLCSEAIVLATRRIVLFSNSPAESFADAGMHGCAFIKVEDNESVPFYVEEIAHQCGHIIFNAVTVDRETLFVCDPHSALSDVTHVANESRSLYVALHGLFTECFICICLSRILRSRLLGIDDQVEVIGRLGYIMRKLRCDLSNLNRPGILSPLGERLYMAFVELYHEALSDVGRLVAPLRYDNQGYCFNREQFVARNAIATSTFVECA